MKIKILSWNIWIECDFKQIKRFLKTSNANIIALQEVNENDSVRETIKFLDSLGYQYVFAPIAEEWEGKMWNYGPAIFTKYKIISSKKYILSEENKRIAIQADIKISNKILHVFNTHLVHTHQQYSIVQMQQVEELLRHIPHERSVLMGDFNAIPESRTMQKVKTILLDADPNNEPTWSVYSQGCRICNPQKIDVRLDYIFTTKDIKTYSYKVENSKGSDHLPISVEIEV
ncbi:MAG TPA: endonuclease/exonuclease/phosphatase family protein [Patescibacteria group bacterium]